MEVFMHLFKISVLPVFVLSLLASILFKAQAQDIYPGYAFYSSGKSCKLYDMDKDLVHEWTSSYSCAGCSRLMRDSSVMFVGRSSSSWSGGGALPSGRFQIIRWDGTLAWDFQYCSSTYCPHHNIELLYKTDDPKEVPNLLIAIYEKVSGTSQLVDRVAEIKPTGATTGEIVWEWRAWDHRTSDPDNHPELLDEDACDTRSDWTHLNSISYNRDLDQLVFGLKSFYEFIIIDHSTTTQEAAGHTGGKYGKGGDVLYRWGKASNYGISGSDYLSGFHSARWVPNIFFGTNLSVPGAGNAVIFHNNGNEVLEVEIPGNNDGIYPRNPGEAFEPDEPLWTHPLSNIGGPEGSIQKLPNGNYFISNNRGLIFELNPSGTTVWSMSVSALQAFKYPLTYFDHITPVKENTISAHRVITPKIYTNPATGTINITFNGFHNRAEVTICLANGKKLYSGMVTQNRFTWHMKSQSNGIYIISITMGKETYTSCISMIQ